ncbi:MAG: LPS export ABC transporter periplasmic protein LptC [Vicinamibacterales bacterium]
MRWQKTARIAIAIGVVLFTTLVFFTLRRSRPPAASPTTPRTEPNASVQAQGRIVHNRTKDGKVVLSLTAEGAVTYPDGRTTLQKAVLTLPDRGGRTLTVSSDEMEVTAPPGKLAELASAKMTGNVRMTSNDGLVVTTAEATYDQPIALLKAPGPVEFTRERLKGNGIGATYDEARQVLWLLKDAKVTIAPDPKGQGALEAHAASAGFARAEHYIRLTGGGRIDGDGRTAQGDDITIQLTPDEKRVQTMQLRGNSRISGTAGSSGPRDMAARDIDLTYGDDGKALQHATLTENATVELPAAAGSVGRKIAARTIVIDLAPDGTTVTNLNANERVQVDLPAEGNTSARRIVAASLVAAGPPPGGVKAATFTGNVEFREMRPARGETPASERIARSQRLIVETKPGFGDIQQADFRGNVRFEDASTLGEAPRGLYRIVDDTLQLSPSAGDPGPAPRISDPRMSVEARSLTLTLESRRLTADTNVRSSLHSSGKPEGDRSSATPKPGTNGSSEKTKLPAMLKSDKPVFVNSNRLEYDGSSNAIYTGDARLFQDQTTVAGDTITLDDKTGNLTATKSVRTVMFFDDVDPKTKERKSTRTTAVADKLVYEDGKRLATYTGTESERANIVGPQGDLTADKIQLFLKEGGNELERAEADGRVEVKEGQRRATGDHLTYTASDETYVINGNPLEADRYAPNECTRTMGKTLRFRRGDDTLIVDGIPGVTPFNTKPIECPR